MFAVPDGIWYDFRTFKLPAARANELAVVFRSVTAARAAEASLRENEKEYRSLFETMSQGYSEC